MKAIIFLSVFLLVIVAAVPLVLIGTAAWIVITEFYKANKKFFLISASGILVLAFISAVIASSF